MTGYGPDAYMTSREITQNTLVGEKPTMAELEATISTFARYHELDEQNRAIIIDALCEKFVRENPQPLTLDELRKRNEKPVWIKVIDEDAGFWVLRSEWHDTRNPEPMILLHMQWHSHSNYGKTWLAYDYPPKEVSQKMWGEPKEEPK